MAAPIQHEGHCLCKRVSFVVTTDQETTFVCFCANCQHVGGGAFAYMKAMPNAKISVRTGEDLIKKYEDWDNKSGNIAMRYFCSHCGSPLYGQKSTGKTIVHMGCLEAAKDKPSVQSFGERRPEWAPEFPGH